MKYNILNSEEYSRGVYKITPIRFEDRYEIMKWRNQQIYHLRQSEKLTKTDQDNYFKNTIYHEFKESNPKQILFSFFFKNIFVGYGGLVHINWLDKNSEISFLMNTELEKKYFNIFWYEFLKLIEKVAFNDLCFHKLYVYAFDLRPHLYQVLENSNYVLDARLNEHCYFNGKFIDVIIYSKLNKLI